MTTAFSYRRRREEGELVPVSVGTTITLDERTEYILSFPKACNPAVIRRLADLNGELLAPNIVVLAFRNFIGHAELAGVGIEVISKKIGEGGISKILQEISDLAASLVFGWRAPTAFAAVANLANHSPVPYHQLQFLRHVMLFERTGQRFQDWLSAIERNPTRRFEPERPVVSPDRVRRLDHRAVNSIFTRLDRLVPAGSSLAGNQLARSLTFGVPPQPHFPMKVAAPRSWLSFDTPENRFVKHVLGECLALIYRFIDHPKLHDSLRADCRTMLGLLDQSTSFLAEVGQLSGFNAPSQALAKSDGYRDVFSFWGDLTRHVSLPLTALETAKLLEGRDMAMLYEYWVFLKVLEATCVVTGMTTSKRPEIHRDELGESLVVGLSSTVGSGIRVRFNPTFTRTKGNAYTTPLRPDVIVECGSVRYAFDAKYRLDYFESGEAGADDESATYKRADLYKMHTYRDAITNLQAAFAVYPGTEFVFFDRTGKRHKSPDTMSQSDGVGAVPLRPSDVDPASALRSVLHKLLIHQESHDTVA
ncbi:MAG TPA: DUF2357 domain-containing protein [Candidatus Angelobacter sp.]|nr:DUF2357 domain-containing protein [Candidatus Angelobacter sp.]